VRETGDAKLPPGQRDAQNEGKSRRTITVDVLGFTWDAIEEEALRQGITPQELARFSLLYYLADCDSGRIARKLPPPPSTTKLAPVESARPGAHASDVVRDGLPV
jgi:hypothetical protein